MSPSNLAANKRAKMCKSKMLLIVLIFILSPSLAHAWNLTLAWDPVSGASGYYLKFKTPSGSYSDSGHSVNVGNVTQYTLTGLPSGTHSFVVTAYAGAEESDPSNEVTYYSSSIQTNLPATTSVLQGGSVTLLFAAKGNFPITFAWTKNGAAISGASTTTAGDIATSRLTLSNVSAANDGTYQVSASNLAGSVQGSTALTVTLKPIFSQNLPTTTTANEGAAATLVIKASGGTPMTVQWYKGATAIGGAETSTSGNTITSILIVSAPVAGNTFKATVTNSAGATTSATTTIAIFAKPRLSQSLPASTSVAVGENVTLSASASGGTPITVRWLKGSTEITAGVNSTTSGTTLSSSLTLTAVSSSAAGRYKATFSNAAASVNTTTELTVITKPWFSTNLPASAQYTLGSPLTLNVVAVGTTPITFEWIYRDSAGKETPLSGATSTTTGTSVSSAITISSPQRGTIYVKATNAGGTVNSTMMTVTGLVPAPRNLRVAE